MTLVCLEQRVRRGTTSAPLVYSLSTESSRSVLAALVRGQDSLADVTAYEGVTKQGYSYLALGCPEAYLHASS